MPRTGVSIALAMLLVFMWEFTSASAESAELAVIVHRDLRLSKIDAAMLKQVFTAQLLYWPDGTAIIPVNYAARDPLRTEFDAVVLGLSPERVDEYWIDQVVRGRARPPTKVPSPALALRLVSRLKGVIAYVPANVVGPEVKVIAYVRRGKVLAE